VKPCEWGGLDPLGLLRQGKKNWRLDMDNGSYICYFSMTQQPLVSQGTLIIETSQCHSVIHTTLGRTPLDKWSARRRDLYLTTHNTHNRQTSMPPARLELTILASSRPIPSRGHRNRPKVVIVLIAIKSTIIICTKLCYYLRALFTNLYPDFRLNRAPLTSSCLLFLPPTTTV
jgi:hypothetical protein